MKPRVRFAPSPTGNLHIGGARTALFNFLFAKSNNGTLVLRIEDTDLERNTKAALKSQLEDLAWLGISWDEGVNPDGISEKGKFGPYKQSQRLAIYQQYLDQMINSGQAYYCFLTEDEIESQKQACIAQSKPYRPVSKYRDLSLAAAKLLLAENKPYVIRFKAPLAGKVYKIKDIVRQEVSFNSEQAGDFVIMRSNGMPMYNFCCVIDDYLMQISHVFRGEEHLTNTLRQLMLYDALSFKAPEFAHTAVILGINGKKLSKRDGAVACDYYRKQGYLPAAVLNYMALLGWNDGSEQEIYSLAELLAKFSLDRLNAAAPVFDAKKLTWINSQHIKQMPAKDLWDCLASYLSLDNIPLDYQANWGELFAKAFADNLETLMDAKDIYDVLVTDKMQFSSETIEVLAWENSQKVLIAWQQELEQAQLAYLDQDWLQISVKKIQTNLEVKGKHLFMPLRIAMIAKKQGAELKVLIGLLPRKVLLDRVAQSLLQCG